MSLVSGLLAGVAKDGQIRHEFTVNELKFVLRGLSSEEQLVADSMVNTKRLRDKYGDGLSILNDTVGKMRTMGMVALATETINDQSPVDSDKPLKDQFKQRLELQEELMGLDVSMMDRITLEYNKLVTKQRDFFKDIDENIKKS